MKTLLAVSFCSICACAAFGQAVITDVENENTRTLKIAPGQILTVRVRGLAKRFDSTQGATSLPLPRDFGGVSVTLRQNNNTTGVPLPLIRGDFTDNCAWTVVIP